MNTDTEKLMRWSYEWCKGNMSNNPCKGDERGGACARTHTHTYMYIYIFYIWVSVHRKPIIYNKPTRCNSGSIVFINNYKYDKHRWLLLHFIVLLMMDAKGVRNMYSILVVVNKHNTARVASCWFIIVCVCVCIYIYIYIAESAEM